MTIAAKNISYRLVAAIFLAIGIGWHFWVERRTPKPVETNFAVQTLPKLQTLRDVRGLQIRPAPYGELVHTCGRIAYDDYNPNLARASKLREAACLLEMEEARKAFESAWKNHNGHYLEVQYGACPDCRWVQDILIEQNTGGEWQITMRKEPDKWDVGDPVEVTAVALRRRPATLQDAEEHVIGESLLSLENANGEEVLAF